MGYPTTERERVTGNGQFPLPRRGIVELSPSKTQVVPSPEKVEAFWSSEPVDQSAIPDLIRERSATPDLQFRLLPNGDSSVLYLGHDPRIIYEPNPLRSALATVRNKRGNYELLTNDKRVRGTLDLAWVDKIGRIVGAVYDANGKREIKRIVVSTSVEEDRYFDRVMDNMTHEDPAPYPEGLFTQAKTSFAEPTLNTVVVTDAMIDAVQHFHLVHARNTGYGVYLGIPKLENGRISAEHRSGRALGFRVKRTRDEPGSVNIKLSSAEIGGFSLSLPRYLR